MSQKTLNITKSTLSKAFSGGIVAAALFLGMGNEASAQVLVKNNGAVFAIKPGATVIVKTGSVENDGLVDNGGTFIIEGDFINQDTANGGGTTGLYQVQEDWVNNGSFQADQSEVELYGANQLITGSNVTTFYDLNLTGTGVKTQTLDANVSNLLSLNDRELATDAFKMFVTNSATTAITRTTGYVSSLGAGRLSRELASTGVYLYPTGSAVGVTRYRPIEVTPTTANTQALEIRLANVDATTEGFDRTIKQADICEVNPDYYHLIGHGGGATDNVALAFYFDVAADGVYKDVAHWQNVPQWEVVNPTTAGASGGLSSLTLGGWNNFSPEAFALTNEQPSINELLTVIDSVSCYGLADGAISVTVSNGTDLDFEFNPNVGSGTSVSNLPAGTYTLIVTDTLTGCNRNATPYTFEVGEPLEIGIAGTTTDVSCFGGNNGAIDLTVTNAGGGVSNITYTNTGQTGANISNLTAGTYIATVLDNNTCSKSDTFEIEQPTAIDVATTITDVTCNGLADGDIVLDVTGGTPGYSFEWADANGDSISGDDLVAGTYNVTVIDGNGCTDTLSGLVVEQPDVLSLIASADTTIAIGYTAELEVLSTTGGSGTVSYEWTPGTTLSDPTAASTTATPEETTNYLVTGTDANGCTAIDTVVVRVDYNLVAIPDGFTPNGDGVNDVFTIHYSDAIELAELKIFNRWGQLIYEANNWDGKFKDKEQPMDTYIYQAVFNLPNGEQANYAGDFILIR